MHVDLNLFKSKYNQLEWINWEFGISRYALLYKLDKNKDLLYSTGNYIQYLVIMYNGKKSGKEYIYIYIYIYIHTHTHTHIYTHAYKTESLCCIPETL